MSDLETAATSKGLRRIVVEPLTRVEGHGKVTILLDDDHRVRQVRLHIVEFRGFEAFIKGRPYWEVPVVVQRLCGICPVSHHLAASKAIDAVVGAKSLPSTAQKLRRLMHYGQILQSHALHFFHLSSPDLLLGFDSDATRRNIVGVAEAHPELARRGVLLRKFGQEVIHHTAGKRIHGTGSIPGGVNKRLSLAERDKLRADCDQMIEWAGEAVRLVERMHAAAPGFYRDFGSVVSPVMSLVDERGALDLFDGGLRARAADGSIIFDRVPVSGYQGLISEGVKSWSYMKFPYFTALGPDAGWYKVGPLARLLACSFVPSPAAEAERRTMLAAGDSGMLHGSLFYHWARLIELLHAAEVIRDLLDDPDITGNELTAEFGPRTGEGVGVIEAPRGTLFHHYRVDDDDLVTYCNLIVSTTNNNQAMNEAIRDVAMKHLDGREVTEGLLNRIEVAIRAFDPCLSCATHALGKMPLEVALVDMRGQTIDRKRKD